MTALVCAYKNSSYSREGDLFSTDSFMTTPKPLQPEISYVHSGLSESTLKRTRQFVQGSFRTTLERSQHARSDDRQDYIDSQETDRARGNRNWLIIMSSLLMATIGVGYYRYRRESLEIERLITRSERMSAVRNFFNDRSTPESARRFYSRQIASGKYEQSFFSEIVREWDAAEARDRLCYNELPERVVYDFLERSGYITTEERVQINFNSAEAPAPVRGETAIPRSEGRAESISRSEGPDAPAPTRSSGTTQIGVDRRAREGFETLLVDRYTVLANSQYNAHVEVIARRAFHSWSLEDRPLIESGEFAGFPEARFVDEALERVIEEQRFEESVAREWRTSRRNRDAERIEDRDRMREIFRHARERGTRR